MFRPSIRVLPAIWCYLMLLVFNGTGIRASVPEQIHLSFGVRHDTMVVMWSSRDLYHGYVQYGVQQSTLTQTSDVSNVNQLPSSNREVLKFIHRVQLEDLKEGCRYYYRVFHKTDSNLPEVGGSDVFSFSTLSNETTTPAKYLVYGDMGITDDIPTYGALETLVRSRDFTAIWHVGDMGYNLDSDNGWVGDEFMRKIQPFAANISYMTSPGNHEISGDFVHYRTRFSMPDIPWPMPVFRSWYSYDIGLVHFIRIITPVHCIGYSSEVYITYNEDFACDQFYWLLGDLIKANQNRDKVPWIIALGHRPMYCSNSNGDDCTNRFIHRWLRYGLEDLFHAQGVDLVIEAHEHSYERLWPVHRGQVWGYNYSDPRASVHVISGAAGNGEGVDWMSRLRPNDNKWSAYRADRSSTYTYGQLVIQNATHIYFEQVHALGGEVIDSFWLQQSHHGPFVYNVTCTGSTKHPSCNCPPPIRYVEYIIIASVLAVVIIAGIVVLISMIKCRKRSRKRIQTRGQDGEPLIKSESAEQEENLLEEQETAVLA